MLEVTHTSRFTMILMSPVLSQSVTLVGHTTSFLRYEGLENSVFQKAPNTSNTFCSTMILMSLVHSGSLSRVRPKTTFARYESNNTQLCRKCRQQLKPFSRWLLRRLYMLQVWVLYDAQPVFCVMSNVRTQLFFRYRKYILEVYALYVPRRGFSVMSEVST